MLPEFFQTTRLNLRPIAPSDAGSIFTAYAQDAEVTRFLIWPPHQTPADAQVFVDHCLTQSPYHTRTYALRRRTDDTLLGALELRRPLQHRLEFGYVLARPFWSQGLMTEALSAVVTWAFDQPAIFRISAVCDIENTGSARVMEKSGLVREATLRRWLVHPNIASEPRDCFLYARTR